MVNRKQREKTPSNFAIEGMEVQRAQDTQFHNYLLGLHSVPDAELADEVQKGARHSCYYH